MFGNAARCGLTLNKLDCRMLWMPVLGLWCGGQLGFPLLMEWMGLLPMHLLEEM